MRSFLGTRHPVAQGLRARRVRARLRGLRRARAPIARDRRNSDLLQDKTLLTAFYQPSTRTRLATEAAMHRLGGHVLGFSDAKMTRAGDFYQESIKDTVHMLEYYGDVIAMRHFQQGAPAEAAQLGVACPIINCGDGWGEHPTQVLTDLYTTRKELGHARRAHLPARRRHADADDALDPLRALAVRRQGVRGGPAGDVAAAGVQGRARRAERRYYEVADSVADVIARVRRDLHGAGRPARLHEVARRARRRRSASRPRRTGSRGSCCATQAKGGAIVLHSLPRMDELPTDVDSTRHAALLVRGLQRRRDADGAARARARRDGVTIAATEPGVVTFSLNGRRSPFGPTPRREPARAPARAFGLTVGEGRLRAGGLVRRLHRPRRRPCPVVAARRRRRTRRQARRHPGRTGRGGRGGSGPSASPRPARRSAATAPRGS